MQTEDETIITCVTPPYISFIMGLHFIIVAWPHPSPVLLHIYCTCFSTFSYCHPYILQHFNVFTLLYKRESLHGNKSLFINCVMVVNVTHFTDVTSPPTPSLSTSSLLHTPPPKRVKTAQSYSLSRYADFLRAGYKNFPVAKSDKFPPTPSKVFIRLALVKKEKVSRAQADNFTRLTLRGDIDQILQVKEPIKKMDDILKADDKVRLVVVEGAPGIGKSTLAWELCRQWPTLESLKRFSLVLLLRLRDEGVQSATDISHLFPCGDDPGLSSFVAQEVKRENGNRVLFMFDGFDEFPSELRKKSLVMDIISGFKCLPKATVLVTGRPSVSAQLQSLLQTGIGKHIEVVGFSEKEIFEFAHSILADSFTNFRQYLSANPVVKGMMYNPLNCAIVVGVYQDTYESGKPVPHTQTQLYTKLTQCLLQREKEHPLATKLPDNLEDLPHDSDIYQQLVKLGELAFNGKLREQVIFKKLPEGCSDLGLLVKHTALYTEEESTTYNFFHLTLQEYMSAFYISQLPADEQRTLFSEHHSPSMDVVWRFVAGLMKMQNIGWEEFKRVKRGSMTDMYEYKMDEWKNVGPFLLECLYETQDIQICKRVFGQHRVKFYSHSTNYGIYALGYCISVCSNTWNVAIVGIPREGLEMLVHGMKSVDYGGGSIEKLFFLECKGIMNEGEHLLQIPHQILQHIKSLRFKQCDIDQRGFENLAECIPYLHSLTSLDISYNPGGDGSLVKLFKALKEHGKLQTLDMTKISIGMDDVAALAGLLQSSSNLRELSVGGSHGPPLATDVVNQLVRTVLSPSSLNTVLIVGCEYPLDGIDTISDNISNLTFHPHSDLIPPRPLTANPSRVNGGTMLSHILRGNTSLKELTLTIPLDKDEVHDIIDSLKDNHSLERLELSWRYHSEYFSESERQALDPRVKFSNSVFYF